MILTISKRLPSKLSAKYQFCAIHTADNTDGKVTGGGKNFTAGKKIITTTGQTRCRSTALLLLLLPILCRAASSAAYSHTGDLEWEVESTSDTFQCGLVGSFTSPGPGIDTR